MDEGHKEYTKGYPLVYVFLQTM
ncbi:hypothetical protein Zm00014a_019662 [Zea mays]|uniref:Uncharacterized protein n=1 Tax=Zea mays TaxID=4577 RepID=A0A3L6GD05_MAIZE|nr:hypothetical protein Zm00014a_019662 [Zea mays]